MINIKTIAVPKEGQSYSGTLKSSINSNISAGDIKDLDLLWSKGNANNTLYPTNSNNVNGQEYEVSVGYYNQTGEGCLFEVGNGEDDENRSNAFEVHFDGNTFTPILNATSNISSPLGLITELVSDKANVTTLNSTTANLTVINSSKIVNSDDIKSDTFTGNTINVSVGNISDIYSNNITNKKMIKTKDLTVTGTAHFFELIIDKIKAAGGAAIFTPADGFDVDVVEAVSGGYKLYWRCEVDGKVRHNMWKVNDQAICMSFNQAKVGVSYNVSNKYYWTLVTSVSEYGKPVTLSDGNKYNWITVSTTTSDGTVAPEVGDSIAMLGYRGTDDPARQSAIYITAYASFDKGIDAPFIAQYKGIKDFDIEKYRTSWWSLKTNKFVGDFVIESTGQNVLEYINDKIKVVDGKIDSSVTSLTQTISENYSKLDQKADGISTRVTNNTTSITKIGQDLGTTNEKVTSLTKTVSDNYSALDQKADSISTTVSSNTKTINELTNKVTQNTSDISSIKQTASSIESTVKSHTESISSIDGRVTTNTENISKIKQTADGISSTVESLGDTYVSKSELTQTSNEILAQVNNNYIKIGDTNITIGGDTTIDGSLTLTDGDQGFRLVGATGVTEIMPKSIGTYEEFKNSNTGVQAFIKNISASGAQITPGNTDVITFKGSGIIQLGDRKKGDYVEVRIDSLSATVTNSYNSSNGTWTRSYAISPTYTANVTKEDNYTVIKSFGTLKAGTTYSVTFTEDVTNARVVVGFSGTTTMSSWKSGYSNPSGQMKPMPIPFANFHFDGVANLPTAAHMLIGYDGWAVNFGNNKTVYCGSDGFIASFGEQTFKITSDGIYNNNKRNVKVLDGTGYSSDKPNTYTIVPPIDTVLCKGANCKVIFPSNPEEGYMITIFDKCTGNCYISSNGKNVQGAADYSNDMHTITNDELGGRIPWRWTYMNNCWYAEYIG